MKSINTYVVIISAFLLIEGVWGMFSNVVFGVLTTNTLHASIHIVLGVTGLVLGMKGKGQGFCIFLGCLLAIVGILRFVPGADKLVIKMLNVNEAVAYVNVALGAVALLMAFWGKKVDNNK